LRGKKRKKQGSFNPRFIGLVKMCGGFGGCFAFV